MSVRTSRLAILATVAACLTACTGPEIGAAVVVAPPKTGYRLTIDGATVDPSGHVVATFALTRDGAPVPAPDVIAVAAPAFTLAGLLTDPESRLATWQSYLLTGGGLLTSLPLGGPGTSPANVLQNQRQPGAEPLAAAGLAALGGGRFAYTFQAALPAGFDPARPLRVGGWLAGVPGTRETSSTFDVVPAGGALARRETVLDAACNVCHGDLAAHGLFRRGVKLCLTCHTIQNADPDTMDPAAPARGLTVVPSARAVVAGTGPTTFAAALQASAAAISWSLSPGAPGTLSAITGGAVQYTPPAAAVAPVSLTLTASAPGPTAAAGLSYDVALTVLPAPGAPGLAVSPAALTVPANAAAVPLTAVLAGVAGPVTWSLAPGSPGTLSATTGAAITWLPPALVAAPATATVTASAGGQAATATLTVLPAPEGSASRFSDPNPLDLGRMVHRIHRGKNLPTLFLASSIAPAPALPSATALPLPFAVARNAPAPGARYAIAGFRSIELTPGKVVSRTDNGQPGRLLSEGIGYPRDLRDCDACHLGAPQAAEVVNAISRRTCQGCHPDVWYGAGPSTDLTHFPHTGGPQGDDTKCAGCHVPTAARPDVLAPITAAHEALVKSPRFNLLTITPIAVTGLTAGSKPTVEFTIGDRDGLLDSLAAPTPAVDPVSPMPRALGRLAITLSGPTSDYATGNVPFTEVVPLTLLPGLDGHYRYTFTAPLPAAASGTWAVGFEARRQLAATVNYDPASDTFRWPYTGEALTEFANNAVTYVDTAFGTWPGGAPPAPRRAAVDLVLCQRCHLDVSLHGGLRHEVDYCVMCHAADTTDWNRRPKGPGGNTNLSTVYSLTQFGAYDGLEERSVHFKVMIHRIHTGEGQGRARLEEGAPHLIYGFGPTPLFFDDVRFPNKLTDCTLCHPGNTWTLEAMPADARPTVANELGSVLHLATAPHQAGEASIPPMKAACWSCHQTAFSSRHAAQYTVNGVEACLQCHVKGAVSVATAHGLTVP